MCIRDRLERKIRLNAVADVKESVRAAETVSYTHLFQKRKGTDLAGASEKNDVTGAV